VIHPDRDRGRVADYRREVAMAARIDPQHTEAGVGIVEGDPLDDASEDFPVGLIGSR